MIGHLDSKIGKESVDAALTGANHALVIVAAGNVGTKCRGAFLPFCAEHRKSTMQNERDIWDKAFYAGTLRKKIGDAFSAKYDLSQPLPDTIRTLLEQLDETSAHDGRAAHPSPPR